MPVTISDLATLLLEAGVAPGVVEAIDPKAPLALQGVDSMDYPLFVALVEERYGLVVTEQEALRLRTLADFIQALNT